MELIFPLLPFFLYYSLSEEKLVAAHMGRPCLLEIGSKPSAAIYIYMIFQYITIIFICPCK